MSELGNACAARIEFNEVDGFDVLEHEPLNVNYITTYEIVSEDGASRRVFVNLCRHCGVLYGS